MRLANKIVLASMNPGKFNEFRSLLAAYPEVELIPAEGLIRNAEKLGLAEIYSTTLENATAKARLGNQASHYPTLADDTGLEVEALGGKPGVHTHRYAKLPPGTLASQANQDKANIELLLTELKGKAPEARAARFTTSLALVMEGILLHSTGTLEGTIAERPSGDHGFGYDPVFIPRGSKKTLAEMTDTEKNAISHRARAIHELMTQVRARGIVLAKP